MIQRSFLSILTTILCTSLGLLALPAYAQSSGTPPSTVSNATSSTDPKEALFDLNAQEQKEWNLLKEQYKNASPEERPRLKKLLQEKMHAKWESMTPEQRTALREKHQQAMKERWEKLSPEEKERIAKKKQEYKNASPEERQRMRQEYEKQFQTSNH